MVNKIIHCMGDGDGQSSCCIVMLPLHSLRLCLDYGNVLENRQIKKEKESQNFSKL